MGVESGPVIPSAAGKRPMVDLHMMWITEVQSLEHLRLNRQPAQAHKIKVILIATNVIKSPEMESTEKTKAVASHMSNNKTR